MDKSLPPAFELDPDHLAHVCEERAQALQARAWHSEAERDALREATAALLLRVARELATPARPMPAIPVSAPGLSREELRDTIATRVVHEPLQATGAGMADAARHAWTRCFKPGD